MGWQVEHDIDKLASHNFAVPSTPNWAQTGMRCSVGNLFVIVLVVLLSKYNLLILLKKKNKTSVNLVSSKWKKKKQKFPTKSYLKDFVEEANIVYDAK